MRPEEMWESNEVEWYKLALVFGLILGQVEALMWILKGVIALTFRNIIWVAMRKHWKTIKKGEEASKNQERETSEILNWGREDEKEETDQANAKVELGGFHAQYHTE